VEKARDEARLARVKGGNGLNVQHGKVDHVTERVEARNPAELSAYADRFLEMLGSGIVTVAAGDMFVIKVSKDLSSRYDATRLGELLGKGGGRPDLVRGKLNGSPDEAFGRLHAELNR